MITRPSSARARARLEGLGPPCNVRKIAEGMTVPARSEAVSRQISSQLSVTRHKSLRTAMRYVKPGDAAVAEVTSLLGTPRRSH